MVSLVRRNMVAFVALFIAILSFGTTGAYAINAIRSADIVDGQVKNQDLAANSVGNKKIQDNSVIGADINESTLGIVPNAARLNGMPLDAFKQRTITASANTDACVLAATWVQCAPVTVVVPPGHNYVVTVYSSVTAQGGNAELTAYYCPAFNVPTCISGAPEGMTILSDAFSNSSTSATMYVGPGTYVFSTAELFGTVPEDAFNAHTVTTVEYHDYQAEGINP
jgi:hypothetical protein